uniref:Short-chain dehydrogenase/reductase n=1 Tax=Thermosporothrix sp. COM3 TaxID=2490863 RepID=A0A455SHT3_9CHLR|nr:short-chain dehydrogenase/reductase [Thermosporothrix sp. COM3]
MSRSYVVTGGGRGIGRAVVERLLSEANIVVAIERDPDALTWVDTHPAGPRVIAVVGDASDENVAERAADLAQTAGFFAGWVNNAAIFRDASLHSASTHTILDLISMNLFPVIVGCRTAIRRFCASGTHGAIVNLSSYQARQAVPGCTPYVTAKSAIEGLTRALAVEYGPYGIRVNAVAPGSVETERYEELLRRKKPEGAARIEQQMRLLHPLGRVAHSQEIAAAIVYLLSDDASFINGATLPVDGGRSVLALDPESSQAFSSAQRQERTP